MKTDADDVYIAFSPAIPASQAYAELLTTGLKKMKSDGSWSALLKKYGL